jgi:hypothetical protein
MIWTTDIAVQWHSADAEDELYDIINNINTSLIPTQVHYSRSVRPGGICPI